MRRSWTKRAGVAGVWLLACGAAFSVQPELGGQVRLQWIGQEVSSNGPLAQANSLQSGIAALPASGATLETELRASGHGINGVVTLQQQRPESSATDSRAWVNELYASHDGGAWQFSAGKKIVAWDVGYGFRPNDMVQQEERRTLVTSTPEGRAILMAEHYSASTAWSLVWVNPTKPAGQAGVQEPALAVRVYQRDGSIDWHGFARLGAHTGASVGGAVAWVASHALELHSSWRYSERADGRAMDPIPTGLVSSNPWQAKVEQDVKQLLIGGTWTNESQVSLLLEAWWDGSAPSDAQWDAWGTRNVQLATLVTRGAPAAAVAGNLAWQAQTFGVSSNLRRSNAFVRLSWQHGAWQPALDVLYTPADAGHVVTASLVWQGDRVQVQGGLRAYGGPDNAVMAQLPSRSTAYVAATWAF
jgi:hypothetical protein